MVACSKKSIVRISNFFGTYFIAMGFEYVMDCACLCCKLFSSRYAPVVLENNPVDTETLENLPPTLQDLAHFTLLCILIVSNLLEYARACDFGKRCAYRQRFPTNDLELFRNIGVQPVEINVPTWQILNMFATMLLWSTVFGLNIAGRQRAIAGRSHCGGGVRNRSSIMSDGFRRTGRSGSVFFFHICFLEKQRNFYFFPFFIFSKKHIFSFSKNVHFFIFLDNIDFPLFEKKRNSFFFFNKKNEKWKNLLKKTFFFFIFPFCFNCFFIFPKSK